MKLFAGFFLSILGFFSLSSCNSSAQSSSATDSTQAKTDTASEGSTAGFKLGVHTWTLHKFTLAQSLDIVDSAGIKYIETDWKQKLGDDMKGNFGGDMSAEDRQKLKKLLAAKGISIIATGAIAPKTREEWIKAFKLAKDFGMSYITAEPLKSQWDMVDSLAGIYDIPVAFHDHPRPSRYWSPDSVLAAVQGHPHLGACADIGHWARNGLDPVDCLKKLEGHIIGVHLKDIVKFNDTDADDTVVSKGVIDIPAVLAELKRQNFHGMISIEHESNWYHSLPDIILTKNYYDAQIDKLNHQ